MGDLEKNHKHYEKAWEMSKRRFARAQRSLGRHYFSKGELATAVDCFRRALDINPLHSNIWFTMGCSQMKLERYKDAVLTFSRCVGIEDDHSEAWANLAASHQALGNTREARSCIYEATKRARENWKMWDSFLSVCLQLKDFQGAIQAMRRLAELDQSLRISQRVMGMLTSAVINDMGGLHENRTGRSFLPQLLAFFRDVTSRNTSVPYFWRFYAALQESQGQLAEALDSRLKQSRSQQARLWEEADPEAFNCRLDDLHECFQEIEEALAVPELAGEARGLAQSFAYSVQNTAQRLQAKLDSGVKQPAWLETLASVKALAGRVESRAVELEASGQGGA